MGAALGTFFAGVGALIAVSAAELAAAATEIGVDIGLLTTTFIAEDYVAFTGGEVITIGGILDNTLVPVTTLSNLGIGVTGLVGTTAILGIGGGIISSALNSGHSKSVPSATLDQILKGDYCGIIEYVSNNGRCKLLKRPRDGSTMRVQNRGKRQNAVSSAKKKVLLSR